MSYEAHHAESPSEKLGSQGQASEEDFLVRVFQYLTLTPGTKYESFYSKLA
jgi:hypothetical protein